MNEVRLGIIGLGNMGSSHARGVLAGRVKRMTLGAVCDIDPAKKEWAAKELPDIPFFESYEDLFKSGLVDAIIVATPHYLHPPIAICAFENGLHVITEKPAGVYTKQVEEMNAAAEKSGKVFGIMYNQRTNPIYGEAKRMIESGELGQIKRTVWMITDWYRAQSYFDSGTWRATWAGEGGGVLINQCPHNLDLWQWICGMPKKVRAFVDYGKYHNIEVEDDVTAFVEYENGATGVLMTTTGEAPGTNRLEISGDGGKIVIETETIKMWDQVCQREVLKFWKNTVNEREHCFTAERGFAKPACEYKEIRPTGKGPFGHMGIFENFTNAILDGTPLLAPGYEGINGLTISNAIHLSSWTNDWVDLPIDKELYFKLLKEKIATSKAKDNISAQIADLEGTF